MKESQSRTAATEKDADQTGKAKKPYQKPSFRHEVVFETMALSCGKVGGTSSQCNLNASNS
jgi:hypothetical protein